MPKLVCQSGPNAGHEYALTKDVTILGRQSSCDVQINDTMSSRAHCQIRRDGKLYSLVDLGSRNGVLLNGKKSSERQLAFGDKIRVGQVEYVFVKEAGDVELKDLLSKYEILEKIGEGGMGIVYKANQRSMARVVALKILSPKYSSKIKFVEQFTREARAAGSLNHPNVIQVHDVGTENDIHYFSMEFVDGPTCMQVLRQQGPFPVNDALEIIRQTAKALEYAHAHRLIHQDIKPDNIMVGPNNIVKLADLGISKTFDEVEADDTPKKVMGTPHYMAPEAALGKKVDQKVDIYSLGATAYHLLCGKTPFSGSSPTEVLKHHVMDPLPPITEQNADVPNNVVAMIERMMAKKPEERYQSATEVIDEIRKIAGSESTSGNGTERVGGSETMILRRYAKGGVTGASIPTPASGTTGSRTPGGDTMTPEGSDAVPGDARLRMLNRVMVGTIAVFVLIGVVVVARSLLAAPPVDTHPTVTNPKDPAVGTGGATTSAAATAGTTSAGATTGASVENPPDDSQERKDKAAAALGALETQLAKDGDKADTNTLSQALEKITDDNLDPDNLERAKALRDKIEQAIQRKRSRQVQAAFTALSIDAQKLSDEHDYDNALKRLDAFNERKDPVVKANFDKLRASIDQAKGAYLAELQQKIKQASDSKDAARLKTMRDSLPPALLGSSYEQDIVKALKGLDDEKQKEFQGVCAAAAKDFSLWHFADFETRFKNNRPAMGASAAGTQMDQYRDAETKLTALVAALGVKLRTARSVRYHGVLLGSPDPDLIDADLDHGLIILPSTGGRGELTWHLLSNDELIAISALVLGKDADGYKPAIATLGAAKTAAGK